MEMPFEIQYESQKPTEKYLRYFIFLKCHLLTFLVPVCVIKTGYFFMSFHNTIFNELIKLKLIWFVG